MIWPNETSRSRGLHRQEGTVTSAATDALRPGDDARSRLATVGCLVVAALWFALALDDARFLLLLAAAGVAIRRFRQLERDFVPDDDDLL